MSVESYSGAERKLLLAFDVGLTYSGISYCILEPGEVPEIQGVHKFPGQEMAGGNAKIPTVMYYSKDGRVRAAGAEAERDGMDIVAEEEDWVKTEWFKLHLHSRATHFVPGNAGIPPLPLGKTAVEVLSDFLKYLNDCARQYIQEVHPGVGAIIWSGPGIHYILPHHNEWEGPQKALMRQAAEKAGFITPNGRNQLTFIAEGKASLHRIIRGGLMSESIQRGGGITIVDAREATVDISAYASRNGRRSFEEIAESQCHMGGSFFVTKAAGEYLEEFLKGSRFYLDIPEMQRDFDTKSAFCSPEDPYFIRFGSVRDRDQKLGIFAGKLRLDGRVIASFFEPSIKTIVDGVLAQRSTSQKAILTVFLVGSFSANDYVFLRVKEDLKYHGLQVFRPDTQINKIVADGAISSILACLSDRSLEEVVDASEPRDLEVPRKNAKNEPVLTPNALKGSPTSTPTTTSAVNTSKPSPPTGTPSANSTVVIPPPPPPPQASPPVIAPSSHFDKLTDDNYLEWKVYMTAGLIRKGLLGVVDGSERHPGGAEGTKKVKKFQNKKARARAELILHVSPSQLIHCTYEDPAIIWNTLAIAHAAHKRITSNTLRRKLHKVRLEHDETMSAFIKRVRHMAFLVKAAGGDIDDDDVIFFITAGLPSSYDSCIVVIDALSDSEYNVEVISAHLIREYQQHSNPQT